MELIIYAIIFASNFDRLLGGGLLIAITLILLIFSVGVIFIDDSSNDKADGDSSSDDENNSRLCRGWTPSRIRWNSTVNVSRIGDSRTDTGTHPPNEDSLLVTGGGDGRGDQTSTTLPLKTWNSKEMTGIIPKDQSSPIQKTKTPTRSKSKPPSRATTPSILKNSKPPLNRSNRSINISPYTNSNSQKDQRTPTKKELLPPLRAKSKNGLNESEIEKLKAKWNNSFSREIGQTVETLEVNKLKKSVL
jgi:hypothetical protein